MKPNPQPLAPRVLLTGGAGYIGSHTYVALHEAGYTPVILDNFSNSHPAVLERLARITGQTPLCERADVRNRDALAAVLARHAPSAVLHFAGDKAVGESVAQPLKYYDNNLIGAIHLLQAMQAQHAEGGACPTLVFSSSATVYGDPQRVPITEDFARAHTNPYGHTKLVIEDMLASLRAAQPHWRIAVLRYFNPVGAHPSGLIGEDPAGWPNNLMPFVAQVAVGQRPYLNVFGNDYPTPDGTGVRDYIHVVDLAQGHVAALDALRQTGQSLTLNLGTGRGHSVLEVVRAFEAASGRSVPYRIAPRRSGDVAQCWADASAAQAMLGWRAQRSLADMCADTWRWQQANPQGYRSASDSTG